MTQNQESSASADRPPRAGTGDRVGQAEPEGSRPAGLPVAWSPSLQRHWLPVDDGGAELMTATFGTSLAPTRQAIPLLKPALRESPRSASAAQDRARLLPGRRWATLLVLMMLVALLLATGASA